jgi:hypothetical protein
MIVVNLWLITIHRMGIWTSLTSLFFLIWMLKLKTSTLQHRYNILVYFSSYGIILVMVFFLSNLHGMFFSLKVQISHSHLIWSCYWHDKVLVKSISFFEKNLTANFSLMLKGSTMIFFTPMSIHTIFKLLKQLCMHCEAIIELWEKYIYLNDGNWRWANFNLQTTFFSTTSW